MIYVHIGPVPDMTAERRNEIIDGMYIAWQNTFFLHGDVVIDVNFLVSIINFKLKSIKEVTIGRHVYIVMQTH